MIILYIVLAAIILLCLLVYIAACILGKRCDEKMK